MKQNIKAEILETAKALFNESGYNAVSMRDIAGALGISVGNLTYHYRKKEDLIEAVVVEQHRLYQKGSVPETLEALAEHFRHMIRHQESHAYYFRHYTQLAQVSPRIFEIQRKVIRDKYEILLHALQSLEQQGRLQAQVKEGQWEQMTHALITICMYGGSYLERSPHLDEKNGILPMIWSVLRPVLTEKGEAEFCEAFLR